MDTLFFTTREEWREWLSEHYLDEKSVWLLFYKKHTGKNSIPYDHSVEEAICFGWIDSLVRRVDDDTYARKFTPRINSKQWSETNIRRARKMINEKKMTNHGKALFDPSPPDQSNIRVTEKEISEVPAFIEKAFRNAQGAWEAFDRLPPSHRRNYLRWISQAKKEETRQRRISEAIQYLQKDMKLPLK